MRPGLWRAIERVGIALTLIIDSGCGFTRGQALADEFEIVNSFGGAFRAMTSQPGRVWIAQGSVIYLLDVGAPEMPKLVSKKRIPPYVTSMVAEGDLLVASIYNTNAILLDYTLPDDPAARKLPFELDSLFKFGDLYINYETYKARLQDVTIYQFSESSFVEVDRLGDSRFAYNGDLLYSFSQEGEDVPNVLITSQHQRRRLREDTTHKIERVPISKSLTVSADDIYFIDATGKQVNIVSRSTVKPEDRWLIHLEEDENYGEDSILNPETFKLGFVEPIATAGNVAKIAAKKWIEPDGSVIALCINDDLVYAHLGGGTVRYKLPDKLIPYPVPEVISGDPPCSLPSTGNTWQGYELKNVPVDLDAPVDDGYAGGYIEVIRDGASIARFQLDERYAGIGEDMISDYLGVTNKYIVFRLQDDWRWFMPYDRKLGFLQLALSRDGKPTITGSGSVGELNDPTDAALSGEYLFIADGEGGIVVARRKGN